jgi:hypothetical protein
VPEELQLDDPAAVKALFDPLRFRLFGLLRTPQSVPELAAAAGVPASRPSATAGSTTRTFVSPAVTTIVFATSRGLIPSAAASSAERSVRECSSSSYGMPPASSA